MVFPELLRGVLSSDSLEDLCAAWVLVYEACVVMSAMSHSPSLTNHEVRTDGDRAEWFQRRRSKEGHTSNIINILINNNIHSRIGIFVGSDVGDGEGFRHDGQFQDLSVLKEE
jgi:hypothetical protein